MQANLNAITSAPWPASERSRWWRACHGAWQADWRERRRDWRVWLLLGLGLALAACAALLTSIELQATLDARASATQAEQTRWSQQGKKYPHSAAHYGVYVFKPLPLLAALEPGVENYVGSSVYLEAHKQNELVYRPAADEAGSTRQFRLTPAFVLQVLAPMAMVFLGFGMFAGERERDTLAALRVNAAPLSALAVARGAVLLCLALSMALPACAAVMLMKWLSNAPSPFQDGALRLAVFGGGYLLYLATWAALIAAVSARSASLRASLAALIAIWAATALVLPRLAVEFSQHAAPLPSMQQFREEMDNTLGMPDDPQEAERHKQALLREHGVSDVKDLPLNWAGISLQRGEEHGDKIFDAYYGRLYAAMQKQSDAAALAGWLSPTVAVAGLSTATAASDTGHHIQFVNAAEAQRRTIQKVLNEAIARHPEVDGKRYDGDEALWNSVPPFRFHFAPLDMGALFGQQILPLLAVFLASLALCAIALRHLRSGSLK